MPFPPVDFPGGSLEVNGNPGTPSGSTAVGDGDNVGVSDKAFFKERTNPECLLLVLVSSKFCLSVEIKVRG